MRKYLALIVVAAVALASWPPVFTSADVPINPIPFSTTSASGTIGPINPQGASVCTITITSGGGSTLTVKGAADATIGGTYNTNTNFGTSGVITAPGANTAWAGNTAQFPLGFEATFTGNGGTLSGILTCTGGSGILSASSGSSNVAVTNTPGVTVQNTPAVNVNNTPGVTVQNTPGVQLIDSGGTNKAAVNASGQVSVTTPAPANAPAATASPNGGAAEALLPVAPCANNAGTTNCAGVNASQQLAIQNAPAATASPNGGAAEALVPTAPCANNAGTTNCAGVDANGVQKAKQCDSTTSTQCAKIDANGVQAHKTCDSTTSTQCQAVDASGRASVAITSPMPAPTAKGFTPAGLLPTGSVPMLADTVNGNFFEWQGCANPVPASNATAIGIPATGFTSAGPGCAVYCDKVAFVSSLTVNTSTQIVALSGTQKIYICQWSIYEAGTGLTVASIQFAGAACASPSAVDVMGAGFSSTQDTSQSPYGLPLLTSGAGQAVCANISGTTLTTSYVSVKYAQF